jgi:hypothetical protein
MKRLTRIRVAGYAQTPIDALPSAKWVREVLLRGGVRRDGLGESGPIFGRIVFTPTIENGPVLDAVRRELRSACVAFFEKETVSYDDADFTSARLVAARFPFQEVNVDSTPVFDLRTGCGQCGAGAKQSDSLLVDSSTLERQGGEIAQTSSGELLVRGSVGEIFGAAAGVRLAPVHVVRRGRRVDAGWFQVMPERCMPPAVVGGGLYVSRECRLCGRSGYIFDPVKGPLMYSSWKEADITGGVWTWEWFGDLGPPPRPGESPRTRPQLLISSDLMFALRKKDPGVHGHPVKLLTA